MDNPTPNLLFLFLTLFLAVACLIFLLVLLFFLLRSAAADLKDAYQYLKGTRACLKGKYGKAIAIFTELVERDKRKWRVFRLRNAYLYNIALCYHRTGEFEKSLEWLAKIDEKKMDRLMQGTHLGLYGSNLLFLDRDLDRAQEYFRKAKAAVPLAINLLMESHVALRQGDLPLATELVQKFLKAERPRQFIFGFFVTLFIDRPFFQAASDFLLGLYYARINDLPSARKYLTQASKFRYENYYSREASRILKGLPPSPSLECP